MLVEEAVGQGGGLLAEEGLRMLRGAASRGGGGVICKGRFAHAGGGWLIGGGRVAHAG